MALSADSPIVLMGGDYEEHDVAASQTIYEGALVGLDSSGYAGPLDTATYNVLFVGHAQRQRDNSSGSAADLRVRVRTGKYCAKVSVTGASARTDAGSPVFASADNTLTLTKSTNVRVGVVKRWVTSTTCIVEFETDMVPAAVISDPSGGATIDSSCRTAIASIIDALQAQGIVKTQ